MFGLCSFHSWLACFFIFARGTHLIPNLIDPLLCPSTLLYMTPPLYTPRERPRCVCVFPFSKLSEL